MNMDPKHCFYLFDKWQDWNRGYYVYQWRIQGFQRPGSCPPPPKKNNPGSANELFTSWLSACFITWRSICAQTSSLGEMWVLPGGGAGCTPVYLHQWVLQEMIPYRYCSPNVYIKKNTGKQLKLIYFNAFFESRSFRPDPDLFSWVRIGTKSGSEKSRSGFVKKTH